MTRLFPHLLHRSKRARNSRTHRRRLLLEQLEDRSLLATFSVVNGNNAGTGSLRQAILDANASAGADLIHFNVAPTDANHVYYKTDGVAGQVTFANIFTTIASDDSTIADIDPDWAHSWYRIKPTTDLPTITSPVTIDGYTQPGSIQNTDTPTGGNNAVLQIELDGSLAGTASGLIITVGNSTVRGLVINRFRQDGIQLEQGDGNVIEGNYIGIDPSGTLELGNGWGGSGEGSSGFPGAGGGGADYFGVMMGSRVYTSVSSYGSSVNRIGTNGDGVSDAAERNVISGNDGGDIDSNGSDDTAERNIISGNGIGVSMDGASSNLVAGNFIGTDVTGTTALLNGPFINVTSSGAIFRINSLGNTIGGTSAAARNVISGNGSNGIFVLTSVAPTSNSIQGNFIGTDVTGTQTLGNAGHGILIAGGGAGPSANSITGNVISANSLSGIFIQGFDNVVQGNFIGTDITGTVDLGTVSDYTAVVTLGDGNSVTLTSTPSTNGQIVAHSDGTFDIQLLYTYSHSLTNQTFGVVVTDVGGASTGDSTVTFSVRNATATISGRKFEDHNGDGSQDSEDQGLRDWTIFLDNGNGALDAGERSTVTDGAGNYSFANVQPGSYQVREVPQAGWIQTTPIASVNTSAGGNFTVDLGNFETITVSGQKFEDHDANGMKDPGDQGLRDWTTILYRWTNGDHFDGIQSTASAPDGTYNFTGIGPGLWAVDEVPQSGWTRTNAYPIFTPRSGENLSDKDLANFRGVTVTGQKFEDHNGNGVRDAEDQGIAGWPIFIDYTHNGAPDENEPVFYTGADGSYTIPAPYLPPGIYSISEAGAPGWRTDHVD